MGVNTASRRVSGDGCPAMLAGPGAHGDEPCGTSLVSVLKRKREFLRSLVAAVIEKPSGNGARCFWAAVGHT